MPNSDPTIKLRLATSEDVPALQTLIDQSVRALSVNYYSREQIESALANVFGVDKKRLPDEEPRLHIEYAHVADGQVRYSWDGMDGMFVENPFRLHQPGEKVPVSVLGGTQVEHFMAIFQMPITGDWWIAYNGDLLGYYPASLFTMLNGGACGSAWYGEVLKDKPGETPKTEMGSGRFPEAGLLNAAYVRNPKYHDVSLFGVSNVGRSNDSRNRVRAWPSVMTIALPSGWTSDRLTKKSVSVTSVEKISFASTMPLTSVSSVSGGVE